jgi:hypothetical protein
MVVGILLCGCTDARKGIPGEHLREVKALPSAGKTQPFLQ